MQALIGYTGFVGGSLLGKRNFDDLYNSKNIHLIKKRNFDSIICAGASAVKWWANKNPQEDLKNIKYLIDCLSTVNVGHFTLISTVDVYHSATGDENTFLDKNEICPYGLNRLLLEDFVKSKFNSFSIIRLPGLFGSGLKKNAIFDMMNDNMIDVINLDSTFQFYPVSRLLDDINFVRDKSLEVINLVPPPISISNIASEFFPMKKIGQNAGLAAHYDLKTIHSNLFGRQDGYIMSRTSVLEDLKLFIR